MFTSHEQELDYIYFFNQLVKVFLKVDVIFDPKFIVIDAAHAIANAIKQVLPNCVILMCWFHLKQNVRKHKSKIPVDLYHQTMRQIKQLHKSTCMASYKVKI